jgi:hypothetical protein
MRCNLDIIDLLHLSDQLLKMQMDEHSVIDLARHLPGKVNKLIKDTSYSYYMCGINADIYNIKQSKILKKQGQI